MFKTELRCALRENKHGFRYRYYFGEPPIDSILTEHWEYGIPGEISFSGSTLIFMAKNFTPSQTMRNELLEPYFDYYNTVGTLILKLDLNKVKKIRKMFNKNPSFNALALHFELHGSFLQENIKGLNFRVMSNTKMKIKELYNGLINVKNSESFDSEAGTLVFIENNRIDGWKERIK